VCAPYVGSRLHERRNLALAAAEAWRPPPLGRPGPLRRFFDLQVGSIWRDVAPELAQVRGTLVDVGCGGQPFRSLLPADAVYVGLDTEDAAADFGYALPDTVTFVGDAWPLPDDSADVVLCTETLEHVRRPERLLAEAARCLRPGGRLLLTVPFAARWHFVPHDYWRFTPSSLAALLEEAGFREVAVVARGNPLTVACYKAMAVVLPLLFPQRGGASAWLRRLAGLLGVPLFVAAAVVANLSLRLEGGDDCLGYTVSAIRA
jgi:SAM-dependent methyltransferase